MVLSVMQARSVCSGIVEERYPGFQLLMDQLSETVYMSLWGLGMRRLEVIFACGGIGEIPVYASEYTLITTLDQGNRIC